MKNSNGHYYVPNAQHRASDKSNWHQARTTKIAFCPHKPFVFITVKFYFLNHSNGHYDVPNAGQDQHLPSDKSKQHQACATKITSGANSFYQKVKKVLT